MSLPAGFTSIRFQLLAILAVLSVGLVGCLVFTLYELDLRKHDYLILNLTGQMRATTRTMAEQARRHVGPSPVEVRGSARDLRLYWRDLSQQLALVDTIVGSLKSRQLAPELTGRHDAITCTWDARSRHQMTLTADDWAGFRAGLARAQGSNAAMPDLVRVADYVAAQSPSMAKSSDRLASAFQAMMEAKLDQIRLFQTLAGGLAILLFAGIAVVADVRVLRPLRETVRDFGRVARGDLGYRVPVLTDNEVGRMTVAFNSMTERLQALFHLTDRVNQGRRLDEMLEFVLAEFQAFFPVDWVGVLLPGADQLVLERMAGIPVGVAEGEQWPDAQCQSILVGRLADAGLSSVVFMPLAGGGGMMVFAARVGEAYTSEHREFLANIAGQVGHILDKTLVTEGLVVAAVEGLAKLAESRDPETGDHLVRMARYSAILAAELGRAGTATDTITAQYVRDVLRFAPMHDIGKVGIADHILLKPGRLDPEERREMERHPAIGGEVLRRCEAQMNALGHSLFSVGIEIAECHHEKFDGSGYPSGLAGSAIPLSARIVAVADVFDALTSKRPYKTAWTVDEALALLDREAGQHFDPDVVLALRRALPDILAVYDRLKHV